MLGSYLPRFSGRTFICPINEVCNMLAEAELLQHNVKRGFTRAGKPMFAMHRKNMRFLLMPKGDISERFATLEHNVNENFFEIQRRLDDVQKFQERAKVNFLDVERKLIEFEQTLGGKPSAKEAVGVSADVESRLMEKIKSLEDVMMLLELEVVKVKERAPAAAVPELAVTPSVPAVLEDRLRTLEEKFAMLEKLKLKVPIELVQHEPRLKSIEENVLSNQTKLHEEVSRLESMIADRTVSEQSAARFVTKVRDDMDKLNRELERAELLKREIQTKEREFVTKPDLEAFEAKLRADVSHIHDLTDRIAAAERSVDSKLVDIEDKLREEAETHRRTFDTKVTELESALRADFETHRRTFDSKIVDLEERAGALVAKSIQDEFGRRPTLTPEKAETLMQRVGTIERDLESRATAIVSKEIAAFAEALDKKFPDLITKADFATWSRAVAQRVQTIEAPDLRPLAERIDRLELRLNELTALIKEIAVRMPIVVE